jgi:hypothetical protein
MPIGIDSTESISLVYYQQGFGSDEFHGYVLRDSEGNVIVDQNESGQIPESVYDIVVCEYQEPSSVGINENFKHLTVYPNPTTSVLNIDGLSQNADCFIQILDSKGVLVYEEDKLSESVDLSELKNGLYLLHIIDGMNSWKNQLIIQK